MKSILIDITCGVSGDMLVGALLDLGLDCELLKKKLRDFNLAGWSINPEKITKYHMAGTAANVNAEADNVSRHLSDITEIINAGTLSLTVKDNIISVFTRLARAEAKVHGTTIEKVHFHEVGAVDSIIDIAAFCIAVDMMEVKKIYFTDFSFGSGFVSSSHGEIPIPVPAVAELAIGFRARYTGRAGECVTPTAAAILTALGEQIKGTASIQLTESGIGFGTRDYPFPSYTRIYRVDTGDEADADPVVLLECNIDDMNPQVYPALLDILLDKGALDAYISPLIMKKGRQGTLLTVIAGLKEVDVLKECIYRETTTLGMRITNCVREKLDRSFETAMVKDQEIKIKVGYLNGEIINVHPEFEDCKKAAKKTGIPLIEVIRLAREGYNPPEGDF